MGERDVFVVSMVRRSTAFPCERNRKCLWREVRGRRKHQSENPGSGRASPLMPNRCTRLCLHIERDQTVKQRGLAVEVPLPEALPLDWLSFVLQQTKPLQCPEDVRGAEGGAAPRR